MRLAVEIFGKGFDVDVSVGWGHFSLTTGYLIDILYKVGDGTCGRQWFDWVWHEFGSLEVWLGRHHVSIDWGPANRRYRAAKEAQTKPESLDILDGAGELAAAMRGLLMFRELEEQARLKAA
ncbi:MULTISPECIES: hypothetical protein [unclassified Methylobacterium]|uniref:hypothetical protein n=1 Tax=unclassified Methylobacterium TaxID=2615210 RepID=UPI0036F64403